MGFRFRKSFGKGPFRMTISKSGVGYSFGGKGARITKKAGGGTRSTLSIPGTGISYVKDSSKKSVHAETAREKSERMSKAIKEKNQKNYYEKKDNRSSCKNYKKLILKVWLPKTLLIGFGLFITLFTMVFLPPLFFIPLILTFIVPKFIIDNQKYKKFRVIKDENDFIYKTPAITLSDTIPLNGAKFTAYINILDFLQKKDSLELEFSLADINATLIDSTISSSTFSALFNEGYLLKISRGKYKLNEEKFNYFSQPVLENSRLRKSEYDNFNNMIQEYNKSVHKHNDAVYLFHTS